MFSNEVKERCHSVCPLDETPETDIPVNTCLQIYIVALKQHHIDALKPKGCQGDSHGIYKRCWSLIQRLQ